MKKNILIIYIVIALNLWAQDFDNLLNILDSINQNNPDLLISELSLEKQNNLVSNTKKEWLPDIGFDYGPSQSPLFSIYQSRLSESEDPEYTSNISGSLRLIQKLGSSSEFSIKAGDIIGIQESIDDNYLFTRSPQIQATVSGALLFGSNKRTDKGIFSLNSYESAVLQSENEQISNKSLKQTVLLTFLGNLARYSQFHDLYQILEEQQKRTQEDLITAEEELNQGRGSEIDILNSKLSLNRIEEQILDIEYNMSKIRKDSSTISGAELNKAQMIDLSAKIRQLLDLFPEKMASGKFEESLAARQYLLQEKQISLNEDTLLVKNAPRYSLSFIWNPGSAEGDEINFLGDKLDDSLSHWSVALQISARDFTNKENRKQKEQAEFDRQILYARREEEKQRWSEQIEQKQQEWEILKQKEVFLKEQLELRQKQRDTEINRIASGTGNDSSRRDLMIQVLDAQRLINENQWRQIQVGLEILNQNGIGVEEFIQTID